MDPLVVLAIIFGGIGNLIHYTVGGIVLLIGGTMAFLSLGFDGVTEELVRGLWAGLVAFALVGTGTYGNFVVHQYPRRAAFCFFIGGVTAPVFWVIALFEWEILVSPFLYLATVPFWLGGVLALIYAGNRTTVGQMKQRGGAVA